MSSLGKERCLEGWSFTLSGLLAVTVDGKLSVSKKDAGENNIMQKIEEAKNYESCLCEANVCVVIDIGVDVRASLLFDKRKLMGF